MADALALELVGKRLVTGQLVLTVGYDIENLTDPERRKQYKGPVTVDRLPVPRQRRKGGELRRPLHHGHPAAGGGDVVGRCGGSRRQKGSWFLPMGRNFLLP